MVSLSNYSSNTRQTFSKMSTLTGWFDWLQRSSHQWRFNRPQKHGQYKLMREGSPQFVGWKIADHVKIHRKALIRENAIIECGCQMTVKCVISYVVRIGHEGLLVADGVGTKEFGPHSMIIELLV